MSSYENTVSSSEWIKKIPYEHLTRGVSHDTFIRKIIQERWLFPSDHRPFVTIVIFCNVDQNEKFLYTLESCILQSSNSFNIVIICNHPKTLSKAVEVRLEKDEYFYTFNKKIFYFSSFSELAKAKSIIANFVVFAKTGDILHLSLISELARKYQNEKIRKKVYIWNEIVIDYLPEPIIKKFIRKPFFELYTFFHINYISYNFAIEKSLLLSFLDFDIYLEKNDAHLILLSVLRNRDNICIIPQYLFLKNSQHISFPTKEATPFQEEYNALADKLGFNFILFNRATTYTLSPKYIPKIISVIIPFRDKPELTCKAIQSVLKQKFKYVIEIILVNNQSNRASIDLVKKFSKEHRFKNRSIRFINYNKPFNHSAQCNIGIAEAKGESIILFNNDVELLSPDALALMSAWSLISGIGTVGVRIVDKGEINLLSAGIATRLALGHDYNSLVEESRDIEFSKYIRETWGNTFACAAISRKTFNLIGTLDEKNFPIGYNDVDYNMRCRKGGLVNMYLGTLTAVHLPGTSRKFSDEIYEKILIRGKYPEILQDSLFQLQIENRGGRIKKNQIRTKPIFPSNTNRYNHSFGRLLSIFRTNRFRLALLKALKYLFISVKMSRH